MEINFDEASSAWRSNKKQLPGGWFAYRCNYIHSNGKRCSKPVGKPKRPTYLIRADWRTESGDRGDLVHYCWRHRFRYQNLIN
jgi:hypothetical protein